MEFSVDRTLLAAPPLIVTLAQVRFEEHAELVQPSVAADLRGPMAELGFPVVAQVHQQQIVVGGGAASPEPAQRTAAGWQFKSVDQRSVVTIMVDQVSLETREYAGWSAFKELWRAVVEAVARTGNPQLATRLGLRYVNRVRPREVHTAAEWRSKDLVDAAFLGPAAGSPLSDHITATEGRATLSFPDSVEAMIHHGVLAEGDEQVFVLDIDCFRQEAARFEVESVLATMQDLNDHSLKIFQLVIKEQLREEMLGGKG